MSSVYTKSGAGVEMQLLDVFANWLWAGRNKS